MRTRSGLVVALLLAGAALAGCRPATVSLGFRPEVGDRYRFQYEVEATLTRAVEGEEPVTTEITTTLVTDEEVLEVSEAGIELRVRLRRDGGVVREAVVLVDRAGSLRSIEAAGGDLGGDALTGPGLDAALAAAAVPAPTSPVAIGDRWSIDNAAGDGTAELVRLGVLDGHSIAVVEAVLRAEVAESVTAGESVVDLDGVLATDTVTSYDVDDGAVREATTRSHGEVQALVAPPLDSTAAPVEAVLRYEIVVRTTRRG